MTGAEAILEAEGRIRDAKRAEYASFSDHLLAFRTVGRVLDLPMSLICLSYLLKHIHALTMAAGGVRKADWCLTRADGSEGLQQRIVDARNYLLLLADIIDEEAVK